ncbi:MAG: hypothetical protein HY667_06370 [Chloroflexi bacterium]|nr:hypothetical protein [Chloroflexota bacterium]
MARQIETDSEKDLDELRERVRAFCDKAGYELSPQADNILGDIVHMKELFGDYYCSCQTQRLPETVCVCQPVRNGLVDMMESCFCGLILQKLSAES